MECPTPPPPCAEGLSRLCPPLAREANLTGPRGHGSRLLRVSLRTRTQACGWCSTLRADVGLALVSYPAPATVSLFPEGRPATSCSSSRFH